MDLLKRINEALTTAAHYRELSKQYTGYSRQQLPKQGLPTPALNATAHRVTAIEAEGQRQLLAA
jgi:hypothetical protein